MTALSYQLNQELETLFSCRPHQYMYLSSKSIVREIASLHGDVNGFVSPVREGRPRGQFAE